jgi:serine/threonine protein kinase
LKHKIYDANGPMPFTEVLDFMSLLCQALQYANNEGFVHANVKPANMLLGGLILIATTHFGNCPRPTYRGDSKCSTAQVGILPLGVDSYLGKGSQDRV